MILGCKGSTVTFRTITNPNLATLVFQLSQQVTCVTLSYRWSVKISFVLIGSCDYFGFSTLLKAALRQNQINPGFLAELFFTRATDFAERERLRVE